jgi:hypothetical protein
VRSHADAAHTFLAVIPGYAEPVRVQVDLGMGETGTVPVLISADALPPHASRVDVEYVVEWLNALPPEARRLLGL